MQIIPDKKFSLRENLFWLFLPVLLANLFLNNYVLATDGEQSRLYSTREERRDAGVKHAITPWFIVSGLAEIEGEWQKFNFKNSSNSDYVKSSNATFQFGFDVIPTDWLKAEILTEYDTDTGRPLLDEATLAFENDDWELLVGKQALDFGVFYSHFASGPAIEFGETNAYSATLAYSYQDKLETSVTVYRGDARRINSDDSFDWSMSVESWVTDNFSFGMSYLSDLADADSNLLKDDGNRFRDKVAGLSAYLLWVHESFEVSLEGLGAISDFRELDNDRNEPIAWNLEFVHFISPKLDWALRLEGSHELEDTPEIQVGFALNYRIYENIFLTGEILHGYFNSGLAKDDGGNDYDEVTRLGALISVAF